MSSLLFSITSPPKKIEKKNLLCINMTVTKQTTTAPKLSGLTLHYSGNDLHEIYINCFFLMIRSTIEDYE